MTIRGVLSGSRVTLVDADGRIYNRAVTEPTTVLEEWLVPGSATLRVQGVPFKTVEFRFHVDERHGTVVSVAQEIDGGF